jgi:hypothetical protein
MRETFTDVDLVAADAATESLTETPESLTETPAPTTEVVGDPKEPVRLSRRLHDAILAYRATTGSRYYAIASKAGVNRSLFSSLLHGKVVGKGDLRLAKIGKFLGLPPEEWEEPA